MRPNLNESLMLMLKFLSFNPWLSKEMMQSSNYIHYKNMKLHMVCLDFDGKVYSGSDGLKAHVMAYKILSMLLREDLNRNLDEFVLTQNDEYLAEAQERVQKAGDKHIWEHMMAMINELKGITEFNREHINKHIEGTSKTYMAMMSEMNDNFEQFG